MRRRILFVLLLIATQLCWAQQDEAALRARLHQIAFEIQTPNPQNGKLVEEAAQICGFAVWDEQRHPLKPAIGPSIKLAITDAEAKAYSHMLGLKQGCKLTDLTSMLDVVFKVKPDSKSCTPIVQSFLQSGWASANVSVRLLTGFLQDLASVHGNQADSTFADDAELDPVQALFILRVCTEEIRKPLITRYFKSGVPLWASLHPAAVDDAPPGWAEDAFVGGITGLPGAIKDALGIEEGAAATATEALGKINAAATITKFLSTYANLQSELSMDGEGPLVRTTDTQEGGEGRTVTARFWIDNAKVNDWLKDHRQQFSALGFDFDQNKSGPLSGVETQWTWDVTSGSKLEDVVRTQRGQPDPSRILTDDKGEAKLKVEGGPQRHTIESSSALPWMRKVRFKVSPQAKRGGDIKQDTVDAITGAIGLKGGPLGLVTLSTEMLYRSHWFCTLVDTIPVKDWVNGDMVANVSVKIDEMHHEGTPGYTYEAAANQRLTMKALMKVMTTTVSDFPELPDSVKKYMTAEQLKQYKESAQLAQEAAKANLKKVSMYATQAEINFSVHDYESERSTFDGIGCSSDALGTTFHQEHWTANVKDTLDADRIGREGVGLNIMIDTEAKMGSLSVSAGGNGKHSRTSSLPGTKENFNRDENIMLFNGISFDKGDITFPVTEERNGDRAITGYSASVRIPIKYGRSFVGNALISVAIERKPLKAG